MGVEGVRARRQGGMRRKEKMLEGVGIDGRKFFLVEGVRTSYDGVAAGEQIGVGKPPLLPCVPIDAAFGDPACVALRQCRLHYLPRRCAAEYPRY